MIFFEARAIKKIYLGTNERVKHNSSPERIRIIVLRLKQARAVKAGASSYLPWLLLKFQGRFGPSIDFMDEPLSIIKVVFTIKTKLIRPNIRTRRFLPQEGGMSVWYQASPAHCSVSVKIKSTSVSNKLWVC